VLFELFNEPVNDGDWDSVRPDMQAWYDVVRQNASQNLVLVGTPSWCSRPAATADRPLEGSNIAYVTHMYPRHWRRRALREEIAIAAARHAVFHTEWGFQADVPGENGTVVNGTASSYGDPFRDFLESRKISWTAWCASYDWCSAIFHPDFTLRTGEGGMGGFLKRWLYDMRARDLPIIRSALLDG
jgi:hypothetical protein